LRDTRTWSISKIFPAFLLGTPPDFLSHSHGEGFLRFFEERCQRQGIFIFDEPESALSPARQIEFLKLMRRMDNSGNCQIIMATHSPVLMAYPNARLLRLSKYGLEPVTVEQTDHYKVTREFCADPAGSSLESSAQNHRTG
jgi:predicted ATPase